MKAKLIKKDDGYNLVIEQPQGRLLEATCSPSQQLILDKSGASTKHKLSKQNCDEIFGVIDVEKLADELKVGISYKEYDHLIKRGIIVGFNKAMELNKDKVFTLEDMRIAYNDGMANVDSDGDYIDRPDDDFIDTIATIQQPTEIEVEIEMESIGIGDKYTPEPKPLLDSLEQLILKKI